MGDSFGSGALYGGLGVIISSGIGWLGREGKLNVQADELGLDNDPVKGSIDDKNLQQFAKEKHG
jgi:hypothetical protein